MSTPRAAIYARKSNEQTGDGPGRSVNRQIEGATEFIASRGWDLAGAYSDDGVSGALFEGRPEFQRMMRDAESGVFERLVLYDIDRFGRHGRKSMEALTKLADFGISVWDYSTGRPLDLDSFEGETYAFLMTRFAQQYRDQVRKHTRSSFRAKAADGYVTGSKIYGFDNVGETRAKKRVPNPEQAEIVREIYERYSNGDGYKQIAWSLNERNVPPPRPRKKPSGWEASAIRTILTNTVYRGYGFYGKTKKVWGRELPRELRDQGQEKAQIAVEDESQWIRFEVPQIVPDDVAAAVDARFARRKRETGSKRSARNVKHLLSGLLICPCGGSYEAHRDRYVCSARRRKGPAVCKSKLTFSIEEADELVLSVFDGDVFSPDLIEQIMSAAFEGQPRTPTEDVEALEREIANYNKAIALADEADIPGLLKEISSRRKRIEAVRNRPEPPSKVELRAALEKKCADWKEQLRKNKSAARTLIKELVGPLEVSGPPPKWMAEIWANELLEEVHQGLSPGGIDPYYVLVRGRVA